MSFRRTGPCKSSRYTSPIVKECSCNGQAKIDPLYQKPHSAKAAISMKSVVGVVLAWINVACAFVTPSLRSLWVERHGIPVHSTSTTPALPDGWVKLPVNPAAGEMSRTISFSPSSVQDLQRMKQVLRQDEDKYSNDTCVVIIPSWRHHLVQYDRLSAALEALDIPTAVHPLPDGLWAFLLRRLQGHALRQAARNGFLKNAIENTLILPFSHLDSSLRAHSGHNPGRRITVLASDDSAWLVRAFINSRSEEWHAEVPLETAVFVGEYHKSIVGGLALDVYPERLKFKHESKGSDELEHRRVRFYGLHGRKGSHVTQDGDMDNLETSISCVSFEEDSESCILQEYESENRDWSSLMGSTALISLWVPRVLRC